ncbi:hypothetical protein E2542_SST31026 [Spatholobus suberectus]|nr:hypothetical protein E2542_SST31026 [Spatholobus suberectus]
MNILIMQGMPNLVLVQVWYLLSNKNRICADYSSFSDIDSDVTSGKVKPSSVPENRRDKFHHLLYSSKANVVAIANHNLEPINQGT